MTPGSSIAFLKFMDYPIESGNDWKIYGLGFVIPQFILSFRDLIPESMPF